MYSTLALHIPRKSSAEFPRRVMSLPERGYYFEEEPDEIWESESPIAMCSESTTASSTCFGFPYESENQPTKPKTLGSFADSKPPRARGTPCGMIPECDTPAPSENSSFGFSRRNSVFSADDENQVERPKSPVVAAIERRCEKGDLDQALNHLRTLLSLRPTQPLTATIDIVKLCVDCGHRVGRLSAVAKLFEEVTVPDKHLLYKAFTQKLEESIHDDQWIVAQDLIETLCDVNIMAPEKLCLTVLCKLKNQQRWVEGNSLAKHLHSLNMIGHSKESLDEMKTRFLSLRRADIMVDPEMLRRLVTIMVKRKNNEELLLNFALQAYQCAAVDTTFYSIVLDEFYSRGCPNMAVTLLDHMASVFITPTLEQYDNMLLGLLEAKEDEEALNQMLDLISKGISPTTTTLTKVLSSNKACPGKVATARALSQS